MEDFYKTFEIDKVPADLKIRVDSYKIVDVHQEFPWIHQYLTEKQMCAAAKKLERDMDLSKIQNKDLPAEMYPYYKTIQGINRYDQPAYGKTKE